VAGLVIEAAIDELVCCGADHQRTQSWS
jgi:hypothetical protein